MVVFLLVMGSEGQWIPFLALASMALLQVLGLHWGQQRGRLGLLVQLSHLLKLGLT